MDRKTFDELAAKVADGSATPDELSQFNAWFNRYATEAEWNEQELGPLHDRKARIFRQIEASFPPQKNKRIVPLIYKIAAAASIIAAIGAGAYFFTRPQTQPVQVAQQPPKDIAPGKQTATLTLANGQKIRLNNAATGQIAKQTGVSITKTAGGQVVYTLTEDPIAPTDQYNTLSTAKGETYQVNLPDGTRAWLNAASSLTYPARFSGTDRKVTLTGEGYFEVAKDKAHPFQVTTNEQEITVLGTHFNLNAYDNEQVTRTTLLEGSVKITSGNNQQVIKPGQEASLKAGQIKVQEIDTGVATAWKNNKFLFDGEDINYIMRMVERWYNVEVVYDHYNTKEIFYGGVSRYENVSEVLKSLESTGKIHFRIEGRKIIVTR